MKNKIYQLWVKGYLYIIIASVLCLLYIANKRVGIYDWRKEIAYFQYIKTSFNDFHCFPLFWWGKLKEVAWYPAISHTSSFIGNPETMLFSPLTILLLFVNAVYYIKLLFVIHFIIGVVGIFLLRNKLKWSDLQFRTYAALFLFSPVIIQHTATGYTPWLNLFFFPLLVYFLACREIFFSSLGISAILALILLQGGTHIFIWFIIFVILYDISNVFLEHSWRYLLHIIIVIALAPLLSFIRIYATAQAYANFHQPFQPGYNPINFLIWAIIPPIFLIPVNLFFLDKVWFGVPSWDGGIFWGLPIIMLPLMIIKYKNYTNSLVSLKLDEKTGLNYYSLLISACILFLLSFFSVFELLVKAANAVLNAPFVESAEKYPFRLMIPAFLGFSVLIAHFSNNIWQTMDNWLKNKTAGRLFSRCIATPLFAKIIMYFSIVLSFAAFLAFALSVIYGRVLYPALVSIIRDTYFGAASQWFAQRLECIKRLAMVTTYFQLQITLLVICIFSLLLFLILKTRSRYAPLFQKTPYASFEIALALPLLFSSFMWLSLALSNPHTIHRTQGVAPPVIKISPYSPDLKTTVTITPQTLVIYPVKDYAISAYVLSGIPAADSRFLDLTSKNASLSASDGQLSILPQDGNPVALEVKPAKYMYALRLTLTAWAGLICVFIANRLFFAERGFFKKHKNTDKKLG